MFLRIPFFGLISGATPMDGLLDHYEKISECLDVIDESLECYVSGGTCREFGELTRAIDTIEGKADKIKRRIRNHLPRGLFMAVDKTLFLNYTKSQDDVLDAAQEALQWLAIRSMPVPEEHQKDLIVFLDEVTCTAELLGPALKATVKLVNGKSIDRDGTKEHFRQVRSQRDKVRRLKNELFKNIYNSSMDFKDIYQLIHFVERLNEMSHKCEACADILRAMIAR